MKILDNVTQTVKDDLTQTIQKGSKLSIASACFSIYAFQELKKQLEGVSEVRFIFTSQAFTTERAQKEKREYYIPRLNRERSLYGSDFEIKLRNELSQKAIAKECADWIRRKVRFRSNITTDNINPFITVENLNSVQSYTPVNGFTTTDIGCSRGGNASNITVRVDSPETDFDSFPDSIFDITNIFMGFLEERPRQHHIVESGYQSIDELIKKGVQIKAFSFSLPNYGYEKTDPHILLSRSNVYLNAELAGGYKVPIEKLEHPHVSRTIDHSVTIGEKTYYSEYEEQYIEGVKSILIGKSITLIVSGSSSGKLSFVVKGSLTQRIQDLEFILAATSNATFSLDGQSYTIKDVENKQSEINRTLEHYRAVKHMLDALDVHEELNVDCITEIGSRTINELIDAVIYGQHMYMPGIQDNRSIITFRFANLYIIIWAEKDQDGKYSIESFTQCGLIKVKYEKTKRVETVSPYVFLGEEQYKLASNINYEHVYLSITSIPISEAYSAAVNKSVLSLISAYDAQTKKDTELLVLAERLFDWLSDNNTKSKDIYLLNKLQAIKRRRDLTIEENVEVLRIKNSDDPTLVFGANILLGDEEEAITAFSKIGNCIRQTELIGMPIVAFLTEESRNKLHIAQPGEANSDG